MNPSVTAEHRVIRSDAGEAVGAEYAWNGGQYCAIHTHRGVVGCGVYDLACADEFGLAIAIAKGTPAHPLRRPEDLLRASIVGASRRAGEMGITPGMTGAEAMDAMLRAE